VAACVIVCFLKAKYGTIVAGVAAFIAANVQLPIGGIYVQSLIDLLWLWPFYGAFRLANPKSYYAFWFYRRNLPKYFRAVQRFGLEKEWDKEHQQGKLIEPEGRFGRKPTNQVQAVESRIEQPLAQTTLQVAEQGEIKTSYQTLANGSYCIILRQDGYEVFGYGDTLWEAERSAVMQGKKPFLNLDGSKVTMFRGPKWEQLLAAVEKSIEKEKARRKISGDAPWRNS
jgi:hypothetical protein